MLDNIGIIFDEGPIARCLVEMSRREEIKFNEMIYLGNKKIFTTNFYINYNLKYANSKPLEYLNKPELKEFILEVERYFNLGTNFFKKAYSNKDLNKCAKKFFFMNNKNINSNKVVDIVSNSKSKFFFNTGKQILKEILNSGKKFLHIHPAILPEIKGADGSLWNLKKKNSFGGSLFVMNKKIDEGRIIFKKELKIKRFNLSDKKFSTHFYDIWFSFIDPAIRCFVLKNSNRNRKNIDYKNDSSVKSEYFSFMEIKMRQKILKDILSSNE